MVFKTTDGKEVVITTDSFAQDEKLGRYVGEVTEQMGYRPSPKWISYDLQYRFFKKKD